MTQNPLFGKSLAAKHLEDLVKDDPLLRRKTMRFITNYFHFVDTIATLTDAAVVKKTLQLPYPISFEAPKDVHTLCANLMAARRRDALARFN